MAKSNKKELKKLPPLTLSLIIISFSLILSCAIFLIFPQYQNFKTVMSERVSKTILLEKQKKIFPIYARAASVADQSFNPTLPLSDRIALDRSQISNMQAESTIYGPYDASRQGETPTTTPTTATTLLSRWRSCWWAWARGGGRDPITPITTTHHHRVHLTQPRSY